MTGRLRSVQFEGPAGILEGLWKDADGGRRGSAVFAHPHPLHGGTMHNKVVYRAAQSLTRAGWATLRFNFRGVGLSEGRYDAGRGEVDDFRAALDEAEREGGVPIVAGGFSFGAAVALKAAAGDARIAAAIVLGLPARDRVGPPRAASGGAGVLCGRGAGRVRPAGRAAPVRRTRSRDRGVSRRRSFLRGKLDALGEAIVRFLSSLPRGRA